MEYSSCVLDISGVSGVPVRIALRMRTAWLGSMIICILGGLIIAFTTVWVCMAAPGPVINANGRFLIYSSAVVSVGCMVGLCMFPRITLCVIVTGSSLFLGYNTASLFA